MMPSVPAFAGDLKGDDALGTRAIMEFQYDSINRGGKSIYEMIAKAGVNPMDYIRFYNLRNYDRINASGAMRAAEEKSGVPYNQAAEGRDREYESSRGGDADYEASRGDYQAYRPPPTAEYGVYEMDGSSGQGGGYGQGQGQGQNQGYGQQQQPVELDSGYGGRPPQEQYQQQGAAKIGNRQGLGSGRWDSVSECYMLGGEDIRNVPWEGGAMKEIDAFVSEELYIHSKVSLFKSLTLIFLVANVPTASHCRRSNRYLRLCKPERPLSARRSRLRDRHSCPGSPNRRLVHGWPALPRLQIRVFTPTRDLPQASRALETAEHGAS